MPLKKIALESKRKLSKKNKIHNRSNVHLVSNIFLFKEMQLINININKFNVLFLFFKQF